MGVVARNRSFLATAALIIVGGLVVMATFTVFFAMAESGETTPAAAVQQSVPVPGSYGITGAEGMSLQVTDDTPKPIANALKEQRGIVLLVYLKGASADMAMLEEVKNLKPAYADDMSFFVYESGDVKRLGDVLDQLGVYDPPVLAVVRGDGVVSELYTGWVGATVLEQRIADPVPDVSRSSRLSRGSRRFPAGRSAAPPAATTSGGAVLRPQAPCAMLRA